MKSLNEYIITESALSDKVFCEQFALMFIGTNLTKDTFVKILSNIDESYVNKLTKYFADNYSKNFMAYEPAEDLFINYNSNKDKITNQIAEYIVKYRL